MSDEARKYLLDISEAIRHIDQHLGGKRDFDYFDRNLTANEPLNESWKLLERP